MDALLTTVCLNITLCNGFFPNNVSSADGVVGINFEPIIPISTSDTEKGFYLKKKTHAHTQIISQYNNTTKLTQKVTWLIYDNN